MKNIYFLLLIILLSLSLNAQKKKTSVISLDDLKGVADEFAEERWGNVDAADPLPYYSPNGNIIAYGFNYAIDKQFDLDFKNQKINSKSDTSSCWGINNYAHIVMGNNRERIAIVRFTNALSDDYAYAKEIKEMASEALENTEITLEKVYYQTPMLKYFKYSSKENSVYVRIFPPAKVLSESEFQEEYVRNFNLDKVMPKSSSEKWNIYLKETNSLKSTLSATYIPHKECMPFLDWHYGCSPTAGGMLLGYWDNYSEYSVNNYSNLSKYHFSEYDPVQDENDYNVSTAQKKCSEEMATNSGGWTLVVDVVPGIIASANSIDCGSYNFTSNSAYYWEGEELYKWNQQISEINASRPWYCGVDGHSMTGVGYEIAGADSFMIVHNTWDETYDSWNYELNIHIGKIIPGGSYGTHFKLTSFLGDTLYNHVGNGEVFLTGNVYDITWGYDLNPGSTCNILYSANDGISWNYIVSNTANDGSYSWTIPPFSNSTEGRLRIECFDNNGILIGSDGSWGSFSFVNSNSVVSLSSDAATSTSSSPSYYSANHTYSTWGVVGVRAAEFERWDIKMYDSDSFVNEVESGNSGISIRYIAFNQHNLSNNAKGIVVEQTYGSGDAQIEFEGYNETLSLNVTQNHIWPANDVVEIWDVYLDPGIYSISLTNNSSSGYFGMHLHSSFYPYNSDFQDNNYRMNGGIGFTTSPNSTSSDDYTIMQSGYYGLVVFTNDTVSANLDILIEDVSVGFWDGDVSTNWHNPLNWSDNAVPTSSDDVVIPGGTPFSPGITSSNAEVHNLTVLNGAALTIGAYDLTVEWDARISGTIAMNHANGDMDCSNIYWKSGSQANISANAEFHITREWIFDEGADVQLDDGIVWFIDDNYSSGIISKSADSYFNDVRITKTNGKYVYVSNSSTEDLIFNGDVTIYSGNDFVYDSPFNAIFNASFVNNGGHFYFNDGVVEFVGNPVFSIKPNVGDYFNNLIINITSDLELSNQYSDSLVINGDLTIKGGTFKSNGNTILIHGNWHNQQSPANFWEDAGTVIFAGTESIQFCYGETFYNLKHESDSTNLHFDGNITINNNFYVNGYCWSNVAMDVNRMYLNSFDSKFTANIGSVVEIDHLDMKSGYTSETGMIVTNGGNITINDLNEDGLYGSFRVISGTMNITQDASSYIDLNGEIFILDGIMTINGGTGTSYWPYAADAEIFMSGGILDIANVSVRIHNSASHALTVSITGGTIKIANSLQIYDAFQPVNGTIELYGATNSNLVMNSVVSALNNLIINKTSASVTCLSTDTYIGNNLLIDGGSLVSTNNLYVGGNWTNNVGSAGFSEQTGSVYFYGTVHGDITTNETFYNLLIDKNSVGYTDLELLPGLEISVTNDLISLSGTFEINNNTTVNIDGDLHINNDAGFNVNDAGTFVYLAGDFHDNNSVVDSYKGYKADDSNTLIFDGIGSNQVFDVVVSEIILGNVIIDKTGSYINVSIYDNVRLKGDLNILNGSWNSISGTDYYFEGDINISSTGGWYSFGDQSTCHFVGNSIQQYENLSQQNFSNVVINTTTVAYGVNLNSILSLSADCNITIDNGQIWANGNTISLSGDIDLNSNGTLNFDSDSELIIGNSGHLNINSGGMLYTLGYENHEVTFHSDNPLEYWQFNCFAGGFVSATWTTFADLDTWGVYVFNNAIIDYFYPFDHCTFLPGEANGTLLQINNSQPLTIEYVNFPLQGSSSYNVNKLFNSGYVTFLNYLGSFAGEAFENDNYNNIHWTSDITVSGVVSDVSCNGGSDGSINITANGGTPFFTYLWSDGSILGDRTGLPAGSYSVTVTDHYGAENSNNWLINEPQEYQVTGFVSDVNCNGGNDGYIQLTLSGGTFPDTYLWSNGSTSWNNTNLLAGIYTVTCTDANGCTVSELFYISEPVSIGIFQIITDVSVFGGNDGAINVTVFGGAYPFFYNWSNGATTQDISGLSAGNYTVTVTDDNGCTATETYVVNDGIVPLSVSGIVSDVLCYGDSTGSIDITVSYGTSPYIYSWSDGSNLDDRTGLVAGTYIVTVTNTNGNADTSIFVIEEPIDNYNLQLDWNSNFNISCNGGNDGLLLVWEEGGGTLPYLWTWNDSTISTNNISAGTYYLTVTDGNGCEYFNSYTFTEPDAIVLSEVVSDVTVAGGNDGTIDLTVSGGTVPYAYLWSNGATTQDISGLTAGSYDLTLTDANSCVTIDSWIVQEPVCNPEFTYAQWLCPTILFYDASISSPGLISNWNWDYGDGSTSTLTSPSHTYANNGTYIVCLSITTTDNCTSSYYDTVEISCLSTLETQIINLSLGWSIFSTYIDPVSPLINDMFSFIETEVIIVKNAVGQVYWPSMSLNMIGNHVVGEGYQIKMNSIQTLNVTGTSVIPEVTPINIVSGWSILGYLRQNPGNIITMLATVNSNISIVKNGSGQVYWPAMSLNMIGNMVPGSGYQIRLTAPATLIYPANSIAIGSVNSKITISHTLPVYYKYPEATSENMTIGIPINAWDFNILYGDEIGVFNVNGDLVGSAVYEGDAIAITIWGVDEIIGSGKGCRDNDILSFMHFSNSTGMETRLEIVEWIYGNGSYEKNDIQMVGLITGDKHQTESCVLYQNSPNPFSNETVISFYLPSSTDINLSVYNMLGIQITELVNGNFKSGTHRIEFNSGNLEKGNYMYRLIAGEYTETKKLSIVR